MSSDRLYSPLAPLAVAAFVIVYVLVRWPLSGDFAGLSMNVIAIVVLTIGGLLGAAQT